MGSGAGCPQPIRRGSRRRTGASAFCIHRVTKRSKLDTFRGVSVETLLEEAERAGGVRDGLLVRPVAGGALSERLTRIAAAGIGHGTVFVCGSETPRRRSQR